MCAENVGFEPTHRSLDLPPFQDGLFGHLSNSPICAESSGFEPQSDFSDLHA